jgi:hypothetical protein
MREGARERESERARERVCHGAPGRSSGSPSKVSLGQRGAMQPRQADGRVSVHRRRFPRLVAAPDPSRRRHGAGTVLAPHGTLRPRRSSDGVALQPELSAIGSGLRQGLGTRTAVAGCQQSWFCSAARMEPGLPRRRRSRPSLHAQIQPRRSARRCQAAPDPARGTSVWGRATTLPSLPARRRACRGLDLHGSPLIARKRAGVSRFPSPFRASQDWPTA